MTAESERHNRLTEEFVMKVAGECESLPELMVVIESTILATMHISARLYGVAPAVSTEMVEAAINHATKRFARQANRGFRRL